MPKKDVTSIIAPIIPKIISINKGKTPSMIKIAIIVAIANLIVISAEPTFFFILQKDLFIKTDCLSFHGLYLFQDHDQDIQYKHLVMKKVS